MKNRIRFLRAEKGWTQQALANRVGISRLMISLFEHWRRDPSLALAYRLADAFEKRIDDVFPHEPEILPAAEARDTAEDIDFVPDKTSSLSQNLVRSLRIAKLWSQRQLANCVGVSVGTIHAIEKGAWKPSLALAYAIAQALGASVLEIFPPNAFTKVTPLAPSSEENP
jgi:putative transcriptional regulator